MQKVMGDKDICILRGHGLIVVGPSVEQATLTAIKARHFGTDEFTSGFLGQSAVDSDEDIAEFQGRSRKGNSSVEGLWKYYSEWLTKG